MGSRVRKICLVFLFFCVFCVTTTVKASTKNIVINDVLVKDKSGTITVVDPVFENNSITSSIIFNEKDDFVTYELSLTNNEDSKYKLESIKDNNRYSNIKIDYVYDSDYIDPGKTKKIEIKLSYKEKIINAPEVNLNDLTITLNFVNESGDSSDIIINPTTGDNILFYLFLMIVALTGLIYIKKRKTLKGFKIWQFLLIISLLLTPFVILALDKYEVSIKFTDIKLTSEYEKYNVIIDLGDGSDPIIREITYGDPIGDLPELISKEGYNNDGWKDEDGNSITKDSIITKPITVTQKYTLINYSITYNYDGGSATNPNTYTVEDEIILNNPTKDGYNFSGWTGTGIDGQTTSVTIPIGSKNDRSYEAHYSAKDDTKYTVIHKFAKLGGGYEEETVEEYGTTGSTVPASRKTRTGFITPEVQNITITGDGKSSVTYVYERETYTFSINDRTYLSSDSTPNGTYAYETEIIVKAVNRPGYNFRWNDGSIDYERTFTIGENTNLETVYIAKSDTPYKVTHKQMNLDGETYQEIETENKKGTTDTEITPSVNTYTGFTSPEPITTTINGDGSTVVEYLYIREQYQVNFTDTEFIDTESTSGLYYYGSEINVKAKNRPGYTFDKWSNDDTNIETTITITGPITITPIYKTNGDTPYTVIHKQMNLDGTNYVEVDRDNLKGTTGAEVTPYVNTYTGFTSPETQTVTISGEGDTVVEYLYTRNKYSFTITDRSNIDSASTIDGEYYYDTPITIKANVIPGYDFKWSDNNDPNYERTFNLKSAFTTTPVYTAKEDTPYKVIHKQMNLDGQSYTTFEEENLKGKTDSEVTPAVKTYTGFTAPNTQTVTISGEGDTVVEYLYSRNKYTLTIEDSEYVKEDKSGEYFYEEKISVEAKDRNGYDFVKWDNEETTKSITITMGTSNISVKPIYTEKLDTPYTVYHKKMKVDGSDYEIFETESLKGKTNSEVTPAVKTYTGFTAPNTQTVTISGEGNTVVEYLYSRNKYTLTINNEEFVESSITSGNYYYETSVTLKAKDRNGYNFVKWSNDYTDKEITITINNDLTIEPIYEEKLDTPYKVVHKKMDLDGQNYTTSEEEDLTGRTNSEVTPAVKTYTGFTAPNTQTVTISGEGDTLVEYLYERNKYLLTLEDVDYIEEGDVSGEYYYGTEIKLTAKDVDGKTFVKWSNNQTTKEITITISDGPLTIRPIYDTNTYTITFEPNGGEVSETSRVINQGSKIGTLPIPTREGYYFDGWYTSLDFDNKIDENTVPSGDLSYYANWKKSVESMTISNTNIEIKVGEEETINITNKNEIEEEYTFTSNNTLVATVDENGKVTGISEGETTVTITGSISGKTKTVNIKIDTNKYVIKFDTNGGNEIADREVEIGSKIGTLPIPTRDNYIFVGWYETNELINIINEEYIPNSDKTIFAKWKKSIAFANISNPNIILNIDDSELINITNKNEIEEEYTFTSNDSSVATVDSTGNVTGISSGSTTIVITGSESNLTKTVNITVLKDKITVKFNPNGGIVNPKSIDLEQGSKIGELPVPTKNENIFIGWFTNLTDGIQIDENTIPSEDVTYYAKWLRTVEFVEIDNPNITITKNDSEMIILRYLDEIQEEISFESLDSSIATVDEDGIVTGISSGITKITITGLTSNKKLEVNVKVLPLYYTVTFNSNDGSEVKPLSIEENTKITDLPTPVKTESVFKGWYLDSELSNVFSIDTAITEDITLYAKWEGEDKFNIVFYEPGVCEFLGSEEQRVTGNNCEHRNSYGYIDTGINLYNSENHDKDFEIGFTIDSYYSTQEKQATLMNTKLEGNSYPGIVFRRKDTTENYDLSSRRTSSANSSTTFDRNTVNKVRIFRIYNESKNIQEIFYSINDEPKVKLNDLSSFNPEFNLPVWFGAAPTDASANYAQRFFNGRLSNMYIRIGEYDERNDYKIKFVSSYSTPNPKYLFIKEGNKLGKLPDINYSGSSSFIGWFTSSGSDGTQIDENTIPTGDTTYYAHFISSISNISLSKTQYNMVIGQTDNITYNSPSYYEPVKYESNNPLVATVDDNGQITAVGVGNAIITLRGIYSNATKQVFVKVTNNVYTITFDANGGTIDKDSIVVEGDVPIGTLPVATKEGFVLDGWYTDETYPVRINENYIVKSDIICHAKWSKDLSNAIFDSEITIPTRTWLDFPIENGEEIEPFTLTSNNTNILQVDSNNRIYSYNEGQTTLEVVGMTSGITRTVTVNTVNNRYTVSFDSNGGEEVDDIEVAYGQRISTLPRPTRENYTFKGWYTSKDFTVTFTTSTYIYNDMTVYALWEYKDDFPLVFNHPEECIFNGGSYITGNNCDYYGDYYIDTGIELYDYYNHDKDYEIGFTIEYYDSNQEKQATIMNTKYEGTNYPGIVFRRRDTYDSYDISSRKTSSANVNATLDLNINKVKIYRIYNSEKGTHEIFYSVNDGNKVYLNDLSEFNPTFDLPVWFGAAPKNADASEAQRYFRGRLSNMYIRLGTYSNKNVYNIEFDEDGGYIDSTLKKRQVTEGSELGALPVPSRSNYTFEGWYTSKNYNNKVDDRTIPTSNATYYAKWSPNYIVEFESNGGTSISKRYIKRNNAIGSLPTPTKEGFTLEGWYLEPEFETVIDSTYIVNSDITLYAKWKSTNITIINNYMCDSNIDIPLKDGTICRRAETLHQEECINNICKNSGYTEFGQKGTNIVTYGNCGSDGKLRIGDAFTCDVNKDGTFDEEKERFYYISDYYNSNTKEYESDTAVLIYYNNLYHGNIINNKGVRYSNNSYHYNGPTATALELPTKDNWNNIVLKFSEKQLLNQYGTTEAYNSNILPIFNLENYTGRLLSFDEVKTINNNIQLSNKNFISNSEFLFENTRFTNNSLIDGYWLENIYKESSRYALYISGTQNYVGYTNVDNSSLGVRPVIDVPKNKMEYGSIKINHTIYLNPNGGELDKNYIVVNDEQALDMLPEPKRVGYEFKGWYKDLDFSVKVDENTIATSDMTLYAKWEIGTYTVTFDTDGGSSIEPYTRKGFETLETLPTTTKDGYEFNGWYDSNLNEVTVDTVITEDITFYAYWNKNPVCNNNQEIEALDGTICKRATNLHQEVCNKTNTSDYCIGAGYTLSGSKKTNIITYGNCGTDGELKSGDAFTCDVNGDGTFDEDNERFYYVSDYYNTKTKQFESGVATLVFFNNTAGNTPKSSAESQYNYNNQNQNGPINASSYLPTEWTTKLYYNNRQILDNNNNISNGTVNYTVYNYNKKGRLLTLQEVKESCNLGDTEANNELDVCEYLLENTSFGSYKVNETSSAYNRNTEYWLETLYSEYPTSQIKTINGRYEKRATHNNYYYIGVRPAVDIPKSKIMYSATDDHVTVDFDTNGGSINQNYKSLVKGDKLGSTDIPTKEANVFEGWYTSLDGGIKVDENYVINNNITLYAHYTYEPLYNKVEYDALNTDTATKYEGLADDSYTSNGNENIYYYNVSRPNNYAIFANYCWKVLRTTNNGGVKLIYYGIPDAENKCGYQDNNAGVIDSNTSNPFNTANSLYSFGYMYQKTGDLLSYSGRTSTLNSYLFGNDVIYDGTYYKLVNSEVGLDSSRKYTCLNNTGICKEVSYFINSYAYYVKLNGYNNIDEFVEKSLSLNTTDSNAKQKIDDWYERNLVSYHEYIDDAIYCNDRSLYVPEDESEMSSWNKDADFNKTIYFNSAKKTTNSLDCPNDTDKFSVSNPNAKLKYPIGLATKDERQLATNINGIWTITQTYLMTPYYGSGSYDYPYMYFDYHNSLGSSSVMDTSSTGFKPVITLKNDVYYTSGDGSMDRPFMVYAEATDKYLIRFDPNEGVLSDNTRIVKPGEKINDLPTPTKEGYVFKGWYTNTEFDTEIDEDTIPSETEITYYAKWDKDTYTVTFDKLGDGENVVLNKEYKEEIGELPTISKENYKFVGWFTTKDSLGEQATSGTLVTKDITYYPRFINNLACENNQNIETNKLCRRAKSLHQDQCNSINQSGCFITSGYYPGGAKDTDIITYGNCGTDKELNVGDAFTCDVNGDGNYDEEKERFYYVNNYYNTTSKVYEKDTAVLLYYANTNNGLEDKTTPNMYHSEAINYQGPVEGIKMLPTTEMWSNVNLKDSTRHIINNLGYSYSGNYEYRFPEEFDYSDYSSRLITYQELNQSCSTLTNCVFALENTKFSNSSYINGYYLETPYSYSTSSSSTSTIEVVSVNAIYSAAANNTNYGIRPAIEVKKDNIEYGVKYDIIFEPNGGVLANNYLGLQEGDTLGTLPTPTRSGYTFGGWYTSLDGGVKIENNMVVTESATYYAHWNQETAACPNNENIKIDENTVCKRAPFLRAQTCTKSDSQYYCSGAGKRNKTVTFGNCGTDGELQSGDAFVCDVNNDGNFDTNYERFYYVSDYYDTKTKEFDDNVAVLIYASTSSSSYAYNSEGTNTEGPIDILPGIYFTNWKNTMLKYNERDILNSSGQLVKEDFSYAGKNSRLLTMQELVNGCPSTKAITERGRFDTCEYLFDNTYYITSSSSGNIYDMYIETVPSGTENAYVLRAAERNLYVNKTSYKENIRTVIEMPKEYMKFGSNVEYYTVKFNPNGGYSNQNYLSHKKDEVIGTLPTPTREGYFFVGWYTDLESGIEIKSSYVPTSDMTLYAKWIVGNYTVSFESNGGSEVDDINIDGFEEIGELPVPIKEGHDFRGWAIENDSFNIATEEYVVTHDVKFYAMWTDYHTVTFNSNNGEFGENETEKEIYYRSSPILQRYYSHTENLNDDGGRATTSTVTFKTKTENYKFKDLEKFQINLWYNFYESAYYAWIGLYPKDKDPATSTTDDATISNGRLYGGVSGSGTSKPNDADLDHHKVYVVDDNEAYLYFYSRSITSSSNYGYYAVISGRENIDVNDDYVEPTKDGATFLGWCTTSTCEPGTEFNLVTDQITDDITLYAKWGHKVSFNLNSGSSGTAYPRYIKEGDAIGTLPTITRSNYTFTGWFINETDDEPITAEFIPTEDVTLIAIWQANDYTVTLDSMGGSEVSPIIKPYNEVIGELPTPTKSDSTFKGWYTNLNYSPTKISSSTRVTGNVTYYAHWNQSPTCSVNENITTKDGTVCRRAKTLHQETCNETSTNTACSYAGYRNNYSQGTTTITYGNCGESGKLNTGDAFTCDVNNDGTFDEEKERFYYVNDYYNTSSRAYENDTAVLVYYTNIENKEPINTESSGTPYNETSKVNNGPILISEKLPTKEEWSNTRLKYNNRYILSSNYSMTSSSSVIRYDYSNYGARFLTLKEIYDKCKIQSNSIDYTGGLNKCYYLLENTNNLGSPTRIEGYWLETPVYNYTSTKAWTIDGKSRIYYSYDTTGFSTNYGVRPTIEVPKSQIDFGQETPYYTLYFNPNNGILNQNYKSVLSTEEVGTLPTPTAPTGYRFIGWFTELEGGDQIESTSTIDKNMTIYAHWFEIPKYTLTYDTQGGNEIEDKKILEGYTIGTLPTPTREGYRFLGWYDDPDEGDTVTASLRMTQDTTIYAHWIKQYTITFNSKGGSSISTRTLDENTRIGSYSIPNKEGFVFMGWYDDDETFENRYDTNTVITKDLNYYAKWHTGNACNGYESKTILYKNTCENNQNIEVGDGIVCKRASSLHQEKCTNTSTSGYCSGSGYTEEGSKGTNIITYGSCGTEGELKSGDAFTCDVNGDGEFNELTERFYYLSDKYNTIDKKWETDTAVLVFYNNVDNGNICNKTISYSSGGNYNGPTNLYTILPSVDAWSNVSLKYTDQQIYSSSGTSVSSHSLPVFSYEGKAARLVQYVEANRGCNSALHSDGGSEGALNQCNFLMESTPWASTGSAYFLEAPCHQDNSDAWYFSGLHRYYGNQYVGTSSAARPVIDVPKTKIQY